MINTVRCILLGVVLAVSASSAMAKRTTPMVVQSIFSKGIEYRAPLAVDKMGVVQAWDVKTGKLLWEKKIYSVRYRLLLERNVQWVFITHLKADAGIIVVTNERGKRFLLNLRSKRVRRLRAGSKRD